MQTNRGVAPSDGRCAQARTRFTPRQRFAKAKLCLSIKGFYCFANLCGLRGAVETRVGWVERSDTHHRAARMVDGFRKGSTHPTAVTVRARRQLDTVVLVYMFICVLLEVLQWL
jgi:hypothetical protein